MDSDWWRGAIIYQVYPRSFFDANNDGTGDLAGIERKLDYIQSLGVDVIWISPFFKSPMRDFGYDVADYRLVDPIFGSNADFSSLISGAHQRGLRVIIDMVLAHSSDDHAWFKQSRHDRTNPKADWYVWADPKPDGTPPNNWLSVFGGSVWQWDSRRGQYYLHHFLRSQPNLNWHNRQVVDAMLGELRFWLDLGVDGFRLDAITTLVHDPDLRDNPVRVRDPKAAPAFADGNNPFTWQEMIYTRDLPRALELLEEIRTLINQYGDRYLIGEVADVDMIAVSAKYTRTGKHLHSCYNFELMRLNFDSSFLKGVTERTESVLGAGWTTWALSNHDNIRVACRYGRLPHLSGDEKALAKVLLKTVLTLRGGACLYQGEELGLTEAEIAFEDLQDPYGIEFWPEYKGRDGCRTPIPWSADLPNAGFTSGKPWLPIPPEHLSLAINEQEQDSNSVLNTFRRFATLRKQHPALVRGDLAIVASEDPVFAFERSLDGKTILCVFNFSNQESSFMISGTWQPIDDHQFGEEFNRLLLPPFGSWFGTGS